MFCKAKITARAPMIKPRIRKSNIMVV
jgi:hypothetical protein